MTKQQIQQLIAQTESSYGLPFGLLDRLVSLESSYNPNAYNSASGASGLTQIIKRYHPSVSNAFDPYEALPYTGQTLRSYFQEFGNWYSAVAAWHSGPGAVRKALAQGKPVPGTVDRITGLPTTSYVDRIVGGTSAQRSAAEILSRAGSAGTGTGEPDLTETGMPWLLIGGAALIALLIVLDD